RKEAKYSYSDIFRTWCNLFHCGGECAEDVQVHLRPILEQIPDNSVPSPDTLLLGIKELATENTEVVSTGDKVYQFNINDKMNDLMVKSLLLTGQLEAGQSYDFDYDNQIIAHDKYDATRTYKKNTGYFPGIASIGVHPVYIENRPGNANVKTDQAATLKRAYGVIERNGLIINRSRFDAGSYAKDIVDVISDLQYLSQIINTLSNSIRKIKISIFVVKNHSIIFRYLWVNYYYHYFRRRHVC
ncbi:MAG: hypothetical protein LBJ04_00150, partial [Sphingobacterium sp.]|nr:hypothetical protein [Sphingobacterium sp.]